MDKEYPCMSCMWFGKSSRIVFCDNAKQFVEREFYLELLDTCPIGWQYIVHEMGVTYMRISK